jgi:photosystem II stability/assembly factor-like uncharacterized protein
MAWYSHAVWLLFSTLLVGSCSGDAIQTKRSDAVSPDGPTISVQVAQKRPGKFSHVVLFSRTHWLVEDFKSIWITQDGGMTWTETLAPVDVKSKRKASGGLSFVTEKSGFAVLDRKLLSTIDGGLSWKAVSDLQFVANDIFFLNAQNGWAVGSEWPEPSAQSSESLYVGKMWRTEDGGTTWHEQSLPKTDMDVSQARWALNGIAFSDDRNGWAVGDGVFLHSSDGGLHWQVVKVAGEFSRILFANPNLGWAIHRGVGMAELTTDGGRTWRHIEMPRKTEEVRIVFATETKGFALQEPDDFVRTADGGNTWRSLAFPERLATRIVGASNFDDTFVGRAKDGTLVALWLIGDSALSLTSRNSGKSWE